MNKRWVQVGLGVAAGVVFIQLRFIDVLLAFLLTGAIPGTSYSVPSVVMLLVMVTLLWLCLLSIAAKGLKTDDADTITTSPGRPRSHYRES